MESCKNCFYFEKINSKFGACNNDSMFMKNSKNSPEGGCCYYFEQNSTEKDMYMIISNSFGCSLYKPKICNEIEEKE